MAHEDTLEPSKSVLIVDDDDLSAVVVADMLKSLGVKHIQSACNGKEAVKLLSGQGSKPDLLISDIFMPEMDGVELLTCLKRLQFKGKVLLVSGVGVEMLQIASVMAREGGLDFIGALTKPISLPALKDALQI